MIKCRCTSCQRVLAAKEKLIGRSVPCPGCGKPFVIAAEGSFPASSSDPNSTESSNGTSTTSETSVSASAATTTTPPASKTSLDRIGRFQIKSALGQGGFGSVYRAY